MPLAPPPIRTAIGWILKHGRRELVNLDIVFARWLQSITDQRVEDEARLLPKPTPDIAGKIAKVTPAGDKWLPADDEEGSDLPVPTPSDIGRVLKINAQGVWAIGDDAVGTPGSGEPNVQADWDQNDNTADSFIKNKPAIPTPRTDAEINALIATALADYLTAAQVNTALALKADLDSPTFTGIPHAPIPGDMAPDTQIATVGHVQTEIDLIPSTPPTPAPATGYMGWITATVDTVRPTTLAEATILAGTAFDTREVVVPASSEPGGYLWWAITRPPTALYVDTVVNGVVTHRGTRNQLNSAYGSIGVVEVNGIDHHVRISWRPLNAQLGRRIRFAG